jgi:hypothetical protein
MKPHLSSSILFIFANSSGALGYNNHMLVAVADPHIGVSFKIIKKIYYEY